ncbi:hypothetical protein TNCV_1466201 [Trichonephila clavipes]|nr:hypothetical protein TNCV_1466201 [Trichonephila clavipes]
MTIRVMRFSNVATDVSRTSDFRLPQMKKHKELKSSLVVEIRQPCPIHMPGYVAWTWLRTSIKKYAVHNRA